MRAPLRASGGHRRRRRIILAAGVFGMLCVGLLAAALVLTHQNAVGSRTESARTSAVTAAKPVVEQLLTYNAATVDKQLGAASAHLTGDYVQNYRKLVSDTIAPAAQAQGISTRATVSDEAVISAAPDHASLLVFVNQISSSAASPAPTATASRLRVDLALVQGDWRVSGVTPL